MSKRKKNRGPGTNRGSGVMPAFRKRMEETYEDVIDFGNMPDEMRLSDRLAQLIEPFMDEFDIKILIDCATIAWNECLAEDFTIQGSYSLNNAFLNYANYRELIDILKLRKRMMFHDNHRHIKEVGIYQKGNDISINVASSFLMPPGLAGMLSEPAEEGAAALQKANGDAPCEAQCEDDADPSKSSLV